MNVTLPGGQTIRAVLVGQRRDETTGAWTCRVELEVWGPDRPVPWRTVWCVPPEAIGRLPEVDYSGVPVLEPYRPPAWRTTDHPGDPGLRLVHYYDCPDTGRGGLVIPETHLYDADPRLRPCPTCRPPLPLPRPAPRVSVDLVAEGAVAPVPGSRAQAR